MSTLLFFLFFSHLLYSWAFSHEKLSSPMKILDISRRDVLAGTAALITAGSIFNTAAAYDPDPDPVRESLYLLSRVQEATCLQERYIKKKLPPIQKMKLTLKLVDRSYRIQDQINYVSKFIPPADIVQATQAGNEAADALQDAIDFVMASKNGDSLSNEQKEFLLKSLSETREKLLIFVDYLPDRDKLLAARARVEEENKLNIDEFDADLANDAGIYDPIELPWKTKAKK
eukprot:CAMPEP_0194262532 /NCGR_PEP_ID=MMETSP0158-20130606/46590_1 /TAXON_ID=33649 /ORGANISM="Thalassionema nitzschioides, Strain L26-B" /LENGTH=229 /DNA_ID=CAMNT_0039002691 /DNA_START=1 /DNA_END=690 /DNA_ORIENTATION=-